MSKPLNHNHRWLSPRVEPFKSSIHGIGLITIGPVAKDEVVQVVGGVPIHRSQIVEYRKQMGHIGIQIHDDFWLVPTNRQEIEETGAPNHSCDPNIGFYGSNIYVTIRNISAREEIVIDYAFVESEFDSFECKCGSPKCRKVITKHDWEIKALQEKYADYFSPYLKAKFIQTYAKSVKNLDI